MRLNFQNKIISSSLKNGQILNLKMDSMDLPQAILTAKLIKVKNLAHRQKNIEIKTPKHKKETREQKH